MSSSRPRAPNETWLEQAAAKKVKIEDQLNGHNPNNQSNSESSNPAPSKKRRWGDTTSQPNNQSSPTNSQSTSQPLAQPVNPADDKRSIIERQKAIIAERIRLKANQSISQPVNQTINQYDHQSINQHGTQAADQPASHSSKPLSSWIPLRLDAEGRQIDEHGQVITFTKLEPRVKANQAINQSVSQTTKQQQHANDTKLLNKSKRQKPSKDESVKSEAPALPSYIDSRLPVINRSHEQRELEFVQAGRHAAQAAEMRQKNLDKQLKVARFHEKEALAVRDVYVIKPVDADEVPSVDWWDQVVLDPQDQSHTSINEVKITPLIYHPVPITSLTSTEAGPLAVILTAAERKKLKRRATLEKQRDEAERIRLGLQQPPPPKLRLSNLMNVLINENISDPSEAERKVRAAMDARQKKHIADNEARKLTPEQKQAKLERKFKQDLSAGCHAALFLCPDLAFGALRYRIDVNARQWNLTGCAVLVNTGAPGSMIDQLKAGALNGVYVEGGKKGVERMIRLLTHRIHWQQMIDTYRAQEQGENVDQSMKDEPVAEAEDDSDDEDESDSSSALNAELLWRGMLPKPVCTGFAFEACSTDSRARDTFKKRGIEGFFDTLKFTAMAKIKSYDEEHKDEDT